MGPSVARDVLAKAKKAAVRMEKSIVLVCVGNGKSCGNDGYLCSCLLSAEPLTEDGSHFDHGALGTIAPKRCF
jgi:NAD(P)H-hydrate repair Nnr-like enzyme with NAD(P)H-hydrate epimerase domain